MFAVALGVTFPQDWGPRLSPHQPARHTSLLAAEALSVSFCLDLTVVYPTVKSHSEVSWSETPLLLFFLHHFLQFHLQLSLACCIGFRCVPARHLSLSLFSNSISACLMLWALS